MNNCKITASHIRYAKPSQLSDLTGHASESFSAWTNSASRIMSGRKQRELAELLGMDLYEFLEAWELRRQDAQAARDAQAELDEFIAALQRSEQVA